MPRPGHQLCKLPLEQYQPTLRPQTDDSQSRAEAGDVGDEVEDHVGDTGTWWSVSSNNDHPHGFAPQCDGSSVSPMSHLPLKPDDPADFQSLCPGIAPPQCSVTGILARSPPLSRHPGTPSRMRRNPSPTPFHSPW
jgi:hypothetical protein